MLYNTSYVPVHDMSATGFVGRMEEICQELEASESDEDLEGGMHPTRVKQEVATERVQKESTEGEKTATSRRYRISLTHGVKRDLLWGPIRSRKRKP